MTDKTAPPPAASEATPPASSQHAAAGGAGDNSGPVATGTASVNQTASGAGANQIVGTSAQTVDMTEVKKLIAESEARLSSQIDVLKPKPSKPTVKERLEKLRASLPKKPAPAKPERKRQFDWKSKNGR